MIALLLGCGMQRAEACALKVEQVRTMRDRILIVDLVGQGGRVRYVAVPQWAALDIQRWIEELETLDGNYLLRSITSSGTIKDSLSPAAIRDIVQRYGKQIGVPDLKPHDLRRSHSRMARLGGAPIEVIQKTLGHASIRTTELYLQAGEEANAGDFIEINPVSSRALHDQSPSLSVQGKMQSPPQPEPPAALPPQANRSTSDAGPAQEPLNSSALISRRAPGSVGRRPPNYPDLNFQTIGEALNISPTYVGRILNGVSQPSMRVAERLAALMGWSIDQVNGLYKRNKTEPAK